jgi:hypothetical protein
MITLATLKDATAQQVFDQVATHLLKQNAKSRNSEAGACSYRGNEGRMCAAGCLIADSEYKPDWDNSTVGKSWWALNKEGFVPDAHVEMIRALQGIHDHHAVEEWRDDLRTLSLKFGLEDTVLGTS